MSAQLDMHFENLSRVRAGIGSAVLEFCRARVGKEFHADELRRFVASKHPTAPASADRILRDLRRSGDLDYTVTSRRASTYLVSRVA